MYSPFKTSTPKESSKAYTFVFGIFLTTRILNKNILWNRLEQCFPVMHGYFQRKLTQNISTIEV